MGKTSLKQLGMQYLESERLLRERIQKLRETEKAVSGKEEKELQTRILILITQARDCKRTAMELINYYEEA